ncbi:hypothetical protein C2857_007688 [Epichloe festucae Fl1]|uniref:Nudix hydrolase domain-containing protein n=1 Tax=Epichloe festucae (strain Fl1) TaxID=877507 RepID=A0A7S9KML9_EPIFF|nr:hypothetical protein C2857_007688 [Epichloe festucae Fl1]
MASSKREASSSPSSSPSSKREVQDPRPSSSVLLLSATNEVLLLHRVKTSTSFASALVFPGGNLDPFHDGRVPAPGSPERHRDGPAYRMGAIRETFEETGILLATRDGALVNLSVEDKDEARRNIHNNRVRFGDFLESIGAVADTAGLMPFTRWITPTNVPLNMPRRFTTQMYIYLLPPVPVPVPVSGSGSGSGNSVVPSEMLIPSPDGGIEHTAAQFAPAQSFLARAAENSIILFPPQTYLLTLLGRLLTGSTTDVEAGPLHYVGQRRRLVSFLGSKVTADTERGRQHATARIPWADKVICPYKLLVREQDGRVVMALDKPGPELEGSGRGGDWERVALVKFGGRGPSDVEIRLREDEVLEAQRRRRRRRRSETNNNKL